jgi:hypothetical protein
VTFIADSLARVDILMDLAVTDLTLEHNKDEFASRDTNKTKRIPQECFKSIMSLLLFTLNIFFVRMCASLCVFIIVCVCVCLYICVCVYLSVCVSVCMCVCLWHCAMVWF